MFSLKSTERKYRCLRCGELFDIPHFEDAETGVVSEGIHETVTQSCCPHCGYEIYDVTKQCDICGEWGDTHRHWTVCEDCYQDMVGLVAIAFNNFKAMHKEATDNDMYDLLYDIWQEHEGR